MSKPNCPKATLVEALRDGRLGAQERASMERHLASCAECAELARTLDRIGDALRAPLPTATPLEHQRARAGLLERASAVDLQPAGVRSFAKPMMAMAMAAAVLLAIGLGWIGGRATAPEARTLTAHRMPRPPHLAAPETSIKPSNDARFERTREGAVEVVTLATGALDVTVRPLAQGERFVVRTGDAEIDVRGTAFRVEADRGKIRGVVVAQGTVEVRYAGFSAVIPAGGSWKASADAPTSAPKPAETASPSAAPSAPPPVAPAPTPRVIVARNTPRPEAAPPAPEPSSAAPAPPPPPAPRGLSPASRAFASAMQALDRGDYEAGAKELGAFASAHADDARADDAEFLHAIALQRAGRTAEAAAAAQRYLAGRPNGAHRAEARRIANP
jgi:ferric-dicitrate binding protein FerR (iron transport regulator)